MVTIRFEERLMVGPIDSTWKARQEKNMLVLQAEAGFSIADAVQSGRLRFAQPVAVLINNVSSDLEQILQEGDEVRLLPQIAGGYS